MKKINIIFKNMNFWWVFLKPYLKYFLFYFFIILYVLYNDYLFNIYFRVFVLLNFCLIYKILYNKIKKNKKKINNFLLENKKINNFCLILYKYTHVYFFFIMLNYYLILLLRKLRYILVIKLNFKIIMDIIDFIYYFIIFLPLYCFFEQLIDFFWKFKNSIVTQNYLFFITNRMLLLLISILISFYFLYVYLGLIVLKSKSFFFYIFYIIFFTFFFLFLQSLERLKKEYCYYYYKGIDNRVWLEEGLHYPPLSLYKKSNIKKIYESRFFLSNCYFFPEEKNKIIPSKKLIDTVTIFDGYYIENMYHYNYTYFKKDIFGNIPLLKFIKFLNILNLIIFKLNFWVWYLTLFDKKNNNCILDPGYCLLEKKKINYQITPEITADYFNIINSKDYSNLSEFEDCKKNYEMLLYDCKKMLTLLDNDNIDYNLIINYNILLDDLDSESCFENIFIDFEFNIHKFKFSNKQVNDLFFDKLFNLEKKFNDTVIQDITLKVKGLSLDSSGQGVTTFLVMDHEVMFSDAFSLTDLNNLKSVNLLNFENQLKKVYTHKEIFIRKKINKASFIYF